MSALITQRRIAAILRASKASGVPVEIVADGDRLIIRPPGESGDEDKADTWLHEHGEGNADRRA